MCRIATAVLLALLLLAPSARGAEQLLDTITVDPDARSVTSGKVTLKKGTRYVIEVTGTMDSHGPEGYGFKYDALYCYGEIKFTEPQCPRTGPSDRRHRNGNFLVGTGGGIWGAADQYTTPTKPQYDTPAVDYDPNHAYTLGFYPQVDGPIQGAGWFALHPDPNEQNTTTGSFTVKVYGEPPASSNPPPAPPKTCASAAQAVARASQCTETQPCLGCRIVGTLSKDPLPPPNKPVDVGGVTISPEAKQILLEMGIEDAESQRLMASLIVLHKSRRLQDQFFGCMYFGTSSPQFEYHADNPQRLSALGIACQALIAREAERAQKPVAIASAASGCQVLFYPVLRKGVSKKRRRQVGRAAQRAFDGSCDAQGGRLVLALSAKKKPMYRYTGRKLAAKAVRVAPKAARSGPKAALYLRWRTP